MEFIFDIIGEYKMKRYKDLAYSLGASPRLFYNKYPKDCLQIDKMIISSPSKNILNRKVSSYLYYHKDHDFYDFSLVMGKLTGVYNLWSYQFLPHEVKQKISSINIDPNLVKAFLNEHYISIVKYFQSTYKVSIEQIQHDIDMMFNIIDDESIYKSYICRDIGKILVVSAVSFKSMECPYFKDYISSNIASGEMIKIFDKFCKGKKFNKKKIISR